MDPTGPKRRAANGLADKRIGWLGGNDNPASLDLVIRVLARDGCSKDPIFLS
jgi:hypothetical protein